MNNLDIDMHEPITVRRDCDAVLIPQGTPITIPADSVVFVTQALGGSITVNVNGNLARVAGRDFDALGLEPAEDIATRADLSDAEVEDLVWEQMRTCYDPEIPINIVDLGLIYACKVEPLENGENGVRVAVSMTLTAPGCGMGEILVEDVRYKLLQIPKVKVADVELTFDPPWDQSMMSEAARLQTGLL
jgi:probable FeS assembly SUF system protein SufT